MSLLDDTLEFYKALLPDLGFAIMDEDEIRQLSINAVTNKATYLPIKSEERPLVLGTKEQLDKDSGVNIIYHPLREDALRGESYTIAVTKRQVNRILRGRFADVLTNLGRIIVETGTGKPPKGMTKLFKQNSNYSLAAHKKLEDLLECVNASVISRHTIGLYLHATDCELDGKKVKRLARVSSALRQALEDEDLIVWGVEFKRKKDKQAVIDLIDSVFPNLNGDEYSYGSNNKTAPYFDALVNAFLNVSYAIDEVEELNKTRLELLPKPTYSWVKDLKNLNKMAMAIPALEGNLGNDVITKAALISKEKEVNLSESNIGNNNTNSNMGSMGTNNTQTQETKPAGSRLNSFMNGNTQQPTNNFSGMGNTNNYNNNMGMGGMNANMGMNTNYNNNNMGMGMSNNQPTSGSRLNNFIGGNNNVGMNNGNMGGMNNLSSGTMF